MSGHNAHYHINRDLDRRMSAANRTPSPWARLGDVLHLAGLVLLFGTLGYAFVFTTLLLGPPYVVPR